jgi:alpha-beta hydrolase superfamily lysophospholipase
MMTSSDTVCLPARSDPAETYAWLEVEPPAQSLMGNCPTRLDEQVCFRSHGENIVGRLRLPASDQPVPVLVICHGAGDWKENYDELCEYLGVRQLGSLALDLSGHGQSGGDRFFVDMRQWVADIRAAVDFLVAHPRVDGNRIGAFGLSSGGTAILEAALLEPRLKVLIGLSPTVRNSLPLAMSLCLRAVVLAGRLKLRLTRKHLRVPLAKLSCMPELASDPEVNRRILADPRALDALRAFPLPGAAQAFFVDTIKRVGQITAPTLVLWGEDDHLDSPKTGRLLYEALTCEKALHLVSRSGHVGHLDRNRAQVFELTADWAWEILTRESSVNLDLQPARTTLVKVIEGAAAKTMDRGVKWGMLSAFLKQHGREALAYATLQEGMEYFIAPTGYIAYTTVQHPVLAPKPRRITLSDPVCAPEDLPALIRSFLADNPRATFGVISEACAEVLRGMGFKINCIGYEPMLPIQTYQTKGNWKELDMIKRARNEARREGIVIREEQPATLNRQEMAAISAKWIGSKCINDREIWLYARRPIFDHEEGVRKFVAYDRDGKVAGFVFYDPMYRDGQVYGYSANIVRCDEQRFGRLATAVHMAAMESFKAEGKEVLNLLLAPFVKLDSGKYNDDYGAKLFFALSARFGNNIYNFKGLSFHKSKYRGTEKSLYIASNSLVPSNDIYLAFVSAEVAQSYLGTLGRLVWGMVTAFRNGRTE